MRYSNSTRKKHAEKRESEVINEKTLPRVCQPLEIADERLKDTTDERLRAEQLANEQLTRDNQILHTMINALKVDIKKYKQNYQSLEIMIKKLKSRTFELEVEKEKPEEDSDSSFAKQNVGVDLRSTATSIKDRLWSNEQKIEALKKRRTSKKKIPGFERLYNLSKKKSLKKKA